MAPSCYDNNAKVLNQNINCQINIQRKTSITPTNKIKSFFFKQTINKILIIRKQIFLILEDPQNSLVAKIIQFYIQFCVLMSILLLIADSIYYNQNANNSLNYQNSEQFPLYSYFSQYMEYIIFSTFIIEFFIRVCVCTSFGDSLYVYIKQPYNIIDLLSLIPIFLDLILEFSWSSAKYSTSILRAIKTIRLFRIIRIFKFSRYMKGLKTLQKSLKISGRFFKFICFILFIYNLFFGTLVYYLEINSSSFNQDNPNQIKNIHESMWLVLVTMTTVGYGDFIPQSIQAKILISFISLISNSLVLGYIFSQNYEYQKIKKNSNSHRKS
ncbi:hypothetical protein IMG5_173950 [Ichthyophthirius multifiliis]|uniref:Ion transport domain-containing protein n=1 Tax=Ichthyophthirius multifiliis TaxID=5932 RepID=G0R205_ICHMU|nr:hypothetical protein IMG5_173950 [Ichthyophthirius multifiliis]EGR28504.1 hypothetical protein IMG5_173950 [Ichthyophthirius multifiliis]|eukprot:XP_004029740.1 hypothetical protein IMG5_173950 [Ichthyophthirius multifiliis]